MTTCPPAFTDKKLACMAQGELEHLLVKATAVRMMRTTEEGTMPRTEGRGRGPTSVVVVVAAGGSDDDVPYPGCTSTWCCATQMANHPCYRAGCSSTKCMCAI
jgi:hypothetical protein